MKIRKATIEDAESVMTVINLAYLVENGDSGAAFMIEGLVRFYTIDDVKKAIGMLSLAELRGKIVGVIGIKPDEEKAFIGPLAVHPSYQGRGISKRLLDLAEDQFEVTVVGIFSCVEILIKMYERRGYSKKGEVAICQVVPKKYC